MLLKKSHNTQVASLCQKNHFARKKWLNSHISYFLTRYIITLLHTLCIQQWTTLKKFGPQLSTFFHGTPLVAASVISS